MNIDWVTITLIALAWLVSLAGVAAWAYDRGHNRAQRNQWTEIFIDGLGVLVRHQGQYVIERDDNGVYQLKRKRLYYG